MYKMIRVYRLTRTKNVHKYAVRGEKIEKEREREVIKGSYQNNQFSITHQGLSSVIITPNQ